MVRIDVCRFGSECNSRLDSSPETQWSVIADLIAGDFGVLGDWLKIYPKKILDGHGKILSVVG